MHPRPLGLGQKVKTFLLKVVVLHIKFKGMKHKAPFKHILSPYTHPQPPDGVKRSKHFFSESSHVEPKGMELRAQHKHIFRPYICPQL